MIYGNEADKDMHIISIMVENHPGVLSRISGLFSRRAYNIDSLSVGTCETPDCSRITIVTHADDATFMQIQSQLKKLVEVIEITGLCKGNAVVREHVLVKVKSDDRAGVMQLCEIYRANIVDISRSTITAELTGSPQKISAFIDLMKDYELVELVRTGLTGLLRG